MFKPKKLIVPGIISLALIISVFLVRSQYVLPIIMYHSVAPAVAANNVITVSASTFEKQMGFLKRNHYNVVSLESLRGYYEGNRKFPARTIAVTLDDGYEDNYTYAFPVLKKYNIPATVFIVVSQVGRPGRLSWEQIKEMLASGLVSFGSHTMTHPFLTVIDSDEVLKNEISGSKKELENKLKTPVDLFCYPNGRVNPKVEQVVRDSGYLLAVATNPGRKFSSRDPFALKRLRISENSRNMFVFWLETSGYYNLIRETRQHKK